MATTTANFQNEQYAGRTGMNGVMNAGFSEAGAGQDPVVSGSPGTRSSDRNPAGTRPALKKTESRSGRARVIIGPGVHGNGTVLRKTGKSAPALRTPDDALTGSPELSPAQKNRAEACLTGFNGDLVFSLYERQERIADRLNKKIGRLDRRLRAIEERGRS